jgi:hypothetical protein
MNIFQAPPSLFSGMALAQKATDITAMIKAQIENASLGWLTAQSADDLMQGLYSEHAPVLPVLNRSGAEAEQYEAYVPPFLQPSGHYANGDRVQGTVYSLTVPFIGNAEYFQYAPNVTDSSKPTGRIGDGYIRLEIAGPNLTVAQIEKYFDNMQDNIDHYLLRCKETLNSFTQSFPLTIHPAIRTRIAKLRQDSAVIGGLKYNLKVRDDAPRTFEAPTVRRKILPIVSAKPPLKGELTPTLAEDHYQHIISILVLMNRVMERSPKAFARMGEEDIRTHYLVQLNGHYEGNATGETFNLEGKTDISVRIDGTVIFVAELKFWDGPKSLREAIDQLLKYVTWRDTKTALVVFARKKDFSKVVDSAVAETSLHPNFKSGPTKCADTRFRYAFKNKNDPDREFSLTLLLFDVPS